MMFRSCTANSPRCAGSRSSCIAGNATCCWVKMAPGKSTLLRVLAGLLTPTVGTIELIAEDGTRLGPREVREWIGYMSHAPMLYDELSATENLAYFAGLYAGGSTMTPQSALERSRFGPDPCQARWAVFPGHAAADVAGQGPALAAAAVAAGRTFLKHGRWKCAADAEPDRRPARCGNNDCVDHPPAGTCVTAGGCSC